MKYPLRNEDGIYYKVVLKSHVDEQLEKKENNKKKIKNTNKRNRELKNKFFLFQN
jgi:hypothetical protein